jgi:hypothetical protein
MLEEIDKAETLATGQMKFSFVCPNARGENDNGGFRENTPDQDGNRGRLSVQAGSRGPGSGALRHGVSNR